MSRPVEAPPALALPAALLSQGFALRPETEADIAFLVALFGTTRADELAQVPWSDEQKAAFIAQQFDAQHRYYRAHIPRCAFDVLEYRGEPIGRLYLEPRVTQLHIVDISLMPEWRGKGVGTAILEAVIAQGRAGGRGVGIFVEKFNPALNLYRRLGFVEIGDTGVYFEMERVTE